MPNLIVNPFGITINNINYFITIAYINYYAKLIYITKILDCFVINLLLIYY
jgi:hypothetical protein